MSIGDKAPTFSTTMGIGGSVTFGMMTGTTAGIGGNAAVFSTTWFCGTTPTARTIGTTSISGRVATGTIGGFGTTGIPGTVKRSDKGCEQDAAQRGT